MPRPGGPLLLSRRTVLALALAALSVPAFAFAASSPDACAGAIPLSSEAIAELGLDPALLEGEDAITACQGKIQPGGAMTAPVGCTMNWIFRDETGALYIGTAGHCLGASNSPPRDVRMAGVGFIGRSVWNVNAGIGNDFGLVKIEPSLYHLVDPSLCHWGGPSHAAEFEGPNGVAVEEERILLHYGYGVGTSQSAYTRPRVQYAWQVLTNSIALAPEVTSGDSGSPVMFIDGGAAGIVTHATVPLVVAAAGPGYATRIDRAIALAEAATGHDFELVTSSAPVDFPTGSIL